MLCTFHFLYVYILHWRMSAPFALSTVSPVLRRKALWYPFNFLYIFNEGRNLRAKHCFKRLSGPDLKLFCAILCYSTIMLCRYFLHTSLHFSLSDLVANVWGAASLDNHLHKLCMSFRLITLVPGLLKMLEPGWSLGFPGPRDVFLISLQR